MKRKHLQAQRVGALRDLEGPRLLKRGENPTNEMHTNTYGIIINGDCKMCRSIQNLCTVQKLQLVILYNNL